MKLKKITLPVAIVLAAIVLAVVYYAVEYNKHQSIEAQQNNERAREYQAELFRKREVLETAGQRAACVSEAERSAVQLNKDRCTRGEYCLQGEAMYSVAQYDNLYTVCLQRAGLK